MTGIQIGTRDGEGEKGYGRKEGRESLRTSNKLSHGNHLAIIKCIYYIILKHSFEQGK